MNPQTSPSALPVIPRAEVRPAWLAQHTEAALEPDLAIIDPHHHLSDHGWGGYLADDLLVDLGSGHRIESTVFIQVGFAYRGGGPESLRPVGETERVVRIAREAAQAGHATRLCAGIVGFADLSLGAAVEEVLAAQIEAGGGRFRGIRCHAAAHAEFQYGVMQAPPLHLYNRRSATASPAWRSSGSVSTPGPTTPSCKNSPTSPAPSPRRPWRSTTSARRSASGPMRAGATRCSRSGGPTCAASPNCPTSA